MYCKLTALEQGSRWDQMSGLTPVTVLDGNALLMIEVWTKTILIKQLKAIDLKAPKIKV